MEYLTHTGKYKARSASRVSLEGAVSFMPGRPPFSFVLLDLPSDHEIGYALSTECDTVRALLHNRGWGSRVKITRAASWDDVRAKARPYAATGFVHLATHGTRRGIALIGGRATWNEVARVLKIVAPRLSSGTRRVLCLS